MSEMDLARALESELQRRGVAFDQRQLLEFVEAIWQDAKHRQDIGRWADELMQDMASLAR